MKLPRPRQDLALREARSRRTRLSASADCQQRQVERRRRSGGCRSMLVAVMTLIAALAGADRLQGQPVPPDGSWSTFDTEHFQVTFAEGLYEVARRAAERAERAYARLSVQLVPAPRGRIHFVVTDHVDYANGFATVIPRNRIVTYAHAPSSDTYLRYYEDWLEILVLHELVHIFHLDNAGGVWPVLRSLLGRSPITFPQALAPGWVTEGLATYAESQTGAGRVNGSMYEMILRTAVLDEGLDPIDHITMDPASWPGGMSRYLYGGFFFDHLADRIGEERVSAFLQSVGRQLVPYRLDHVAKGTLGISLTSAWNAWGDSLRISYSGLAEALSEPGLTEPEILTREGWVAAYPRFSSDGSKLTFSGSTGRSEPAVNLLEPGRAPVRFAPVTAIGPFEWADTNGALLGAQLEFTSTHTVTSDLVSFDADGGLVRLTRGARVREPSQHPDGRRVLVVAAYAGTNVLAVIDRATGELKTLMDPDLDVHWADPRWSPDGSMIAVSRWSPGGGMDVVVVDTTGLVIDEVTRGRSVDTHPAWSPDGRYIVYSSDRSGITNLYAYDRSEGRHLQLTNVLTGAFQPDVSPDARWIAFSYYQPDGYHIARIPFDPANGWGVDPPTAELPAVLARSRTSLEAEAGGEPRPYSAWPTVLPAWWSPIVVGGGDEWTGVGIVTNGADVLEKHSWALDVTAFPREGRGAAGLAYRYRGWGNPVLGATLHQGWQVQNVSESAERIPFPELARRDREVEVGLTWQHQRWRRAGWVQVSGELSDIDFVWGEQDEGGERREDVRYPLDAGVTFGAGLSTVRAFPLSVGPGQGARTSLRLEARRYLDLPPVPTARRDYWRIISDNDAYLSRNLFGFAPSTLALRFGAGAETSEVAPGFTVGGAGASGSPLAIAAGAGGNSASYPVRGYPTGVQRGNRVVGGTAEYRFPIALVERGYRLVPVAVDRIWGDVFMEAGAAWCEGACRTSLPNLRTSARPLLSAGAEGILHMRIGHHLDLPVRAGIAFPLRDGKEYDPRFYLRIGRSF